ncbi:hypothetical protein PoB_003740000 [Plakobranchus ocellatus]|uniref:Uncharacterized protein n=1 Tax=Plakobranchus ocellatus TaxID=259542 RepID=A0AAV4AU99_9GAST|nr:hypothetical protein PoB_003740000 [Plakobranchus ocellatus]
MENKSVCYYISYLTSTTEGDRGPVVSKVALKPLVLFKSEVTTCLLRGSVGGTVTSESVLKSEGTILSWVRTLPPSLHPAGGPDSLGSPYCGLAIYEKQTKKQQQQQQQKSHACYEQNV